MYAKVNVCWHIPIVDPQGSKEVLKQHMIGFVAGYLFGLGARKSEHFTVEIKDEPKHDQDSEQSGASGPALGVAANPESPETPG